MAEVISSSIIVNVALLVLLYFVLKVENTIIYEGDHYEPWISQNPNTEVDRKLIVKTLYQVLYTWVLLVLVTILINWSRSSDFTNEQPNTRGMEGTCHNPDHKVQRQTGTNIKQEESQGIREDVIVPGKRVNIRNFRDIGGNFIAGDCVGNTFRLSRKKKAPCMDTLKGFEVHV